MDTPKPPQKSAHLLDDLESIRQLLGDDNLQPPLLTDTVNEDEQEQIPMLFDTSGATPGAVEPPPAPAAQPAAAASKGPDALLHLDSELRAAAQLILQGHVRLKFEPPLLAFGIATFIAAHVMAEARRIADENASIL